MLVGVALGLALLVPVEQAEGVRHAVDAQEVQGVQHVGGDGLILAPVDVGGVVPRRQNGEVVPAAAHGAHLGHGGVVPVQGHQPGDAPLHRQLEEQVRLADAILGQGGLNIVDHHRHRALAHRLLRQVRHPGEQVHVLRLRGRRGGGGGLGSGRRSGGPGGHHRPGGAGLLLVVEKAAARDQAQQQPQAHSQHGKRTQRGSHDTHSFPNHIPPPERPGFPSPAE